MQDTAEVLVDEELFYSTVHQHGAQKGQIKSANCILCLVRNALLILLKRSERV